MQTSQGYIFCTLQHFITKFCNFTDFNKFFTGIYFFLPKSKISQTCKSQGLRNCENEDSSLFSYYEDPKIFIYIVFAKISVKVKSVAKWKIKFQYVFRGLLPLAKNIAYQKSQKNREILPKVIKI
jgi:hypothetical protein